MNRRVATLVILFGCVLSLGMATPVAAGPDDLEGILNDMEGEGTEDNPYVITTTEELQAVNADLDAHYELGNDIDASETETWYSGNGFDPIGESGNVFAGSFDGNGYTIDGLYIDRPSESNVALFGATNTPEDDISNVGVTNVDVTGGTEYTGGLVGLHMGGVSDSYVTGSVIGDSDVGGLAGYSIGDIHTSYAATTVEGDNNVGGLAGTASDEQYIENAYWDTTESGTSESGGGTGLSTEDMTGDSAQNNMNFDWDNTWETTDSYPVLTTEDLSNIEVYGFGQNDFMEDETPTVSGIVENTGDEESTQTIEFFFDGTVQQTQEVTLGAGDLTTVEFTFPNADPGEYTYTITSEDDTYESTVTVLSYDHFEVTVTDPDPIPVDGSGVVTAEVQNTGDFEGTQTIEFEYDDSLESTEEVSLGAGESTELDFTVPVNETGEFAYSVSSENVTATGTVEVYEGGYFDVSVDAPDEIYVDDDVTVDATIENRGDAETTQEIVYTFDNKTEATTNVTLDGGESTTIEFEIPGLGEGDFAYGVLSEDTDATGKISMFERETGVVPTPIGCDGIEIGGACIPNGSALIFGSIVLVFGTLGVLVFRGSNSRLSNP